MTTVLRAEHEGVQDSCLGHLVDLTLAGSNGSAKGCQKTQYCR